MSGSTTPTDAPTSGSPTRAARTGKYVMVLALPAFASGPDRFEVESAFAKHLRTLRAKLGPLARELVLMGPGADENLRKVMPLDTVHASEGIRFRPLFDHRVGRLGMLRAWPRVRATLREEIEGADVVHAGPSSAYRPFEFAALRLAHRLGKKTIFVTDIDNRESARMRRESGFDSARVYAMHQLLHAPLMHRQHRIAARDFSLVLLKGRKLASDYGQGRANVKNFLDAAFEAEHLIAPERLAAKLDAARDATQPLKLIYFGRLVDYKGVDHMLRAVRHACDAGARVRFEIVGDGDQRGALEHLVRALNFDAGVVTFVGALPFGPALFARLHDAQVLLAAPLSEDTPRSALDALASAQTIVAYDTYYYRELAEAGAPVTVVPWRDVRALGDAIVAIARDRARLVDGLRSARAFAEPNTQEAWLDRRIEWTRALFERG